MLSNYFSFQGRISRKIFWKTYLINYVAGIIALLFLINGVSFWLSGGNLLFIWLFSLAGSVPEFLGNESIKGLFVVLAVVALPVLIMLVPMQFSIMVRRLHDMNFSAKVLVYFVIAQQVLRAMTKTADVTIWASLFIQFVIFFTVIAFLGIMKGTSGPNKYGEDPLGPAFDGKTPLQTATAPFVPSV